MQFCCDLKTSNIFLRHLLIKLTTLSLLITLFGNIAIQTFHHHSESKTTYKSNSIDNVKSAEHCKVCDHFHQHSSPALATDFILSSIFKLSPAPQHTIFKQAKIDSRSLEGYTNKGPPKA
jgi:hypothetical protein